jgi:hypothetical protein
MTATAHRGALPGRWRRYRSRDGAHRDGSGVRALQPGLRRDRRPSEGGRARHAWAWMREALGLAKCKKPSVEAKESDKAASQGRTHFNRKLLRCGNSRVALSAPSPLPVVGTPHMTLAAGTNRSHVFLSFTAALIAGVFSVAPCAEETGHRDYHDSDYRHWKQPGTDVSCCSDQDCAPVKAELRLGHWWALRQREWVVVPDDKIISVSNPTIEGAHLCYSKGKVVCFVPPNIGG